MSKIRNSSTTTSNTNRQSVPQQHVSSSKQKDLVSAQIMNKKRSALGNISNVIKYIKKKKNSIYYI